MAFDVRVFGGQLLRAGRYLYRFLRLPRFKEGDIYLDCNWHPVVCTEAVVVSYSPLGAWDIHLEGVSLVDGTYPRGCSVIHCAPEKLTYPVAEHIVALMVGLNEELDESLQRPADAVEHIQKILTTRGLSFSFINY